MYKNAPFFVRSMYKKGGILRRYPRQLESVMR